MIFGTEWENNSHNVLHMFTHSNKQNYRKAHLFQTIEFHTLLSVIQFALLPASPLSFRSLFPLHTPLNTHLASPYPLPDNCLNLMLKSNDPGKC